MQSGCWKLRKSFASRERGRGQRGGWCNCFIGIRAPSFLTFPFLLPTHALAHLHQEAHPAHRPAVARAAPDTQHRGQDDHKDGAHHRQEDPYIVIWLGEGAERDRVTPVEGAGPTREKHRRHVENRAGALSLQEGVVRL